MAQQLSVTILGSNSALPVSGRNPTAQILSSRGHLYLIDCGEGTQMQLRRFHVKMQRIKAVFISHLHGDHYFGLPGLLNTMHLLGRTRELTLVAPSPLQEILRLQMDVASSRFQYPIHFVHTDEASRSAEPTAVFEDDQIHVKAFPLKHRIACCGFRFEQHPTERTYLPEVGGPLGVKLQDIPRIKQGEDFVREDGSRIPNEKLTLDPPRPLSYAFCTDTLPLESTAVHCRGVDLLYHEATFADDEAKRAKETHHSTARQAAIVARYAGAKRLLLGHYSARYTDLEVMQTEASAEFTNVELAIDGLTVDI